jgi:hypothetical protein
MESLKCKARLAVLWLIQSASFTAFLILQSVEHRASAANQAGGMEDVKASLLGIAIFYLILWLMAWLSMTLKDAANRWTNFVLGLLFAIILGLVSLRTASAGASSAQVLNVFWGFVIALLTIWYSWKWPKQEA